MRISDWMSDVCSSDLTVVFDKTGTLTLGSHRVVKTTAADGLTDDEVLRVAASVQRDAEHPIAQALMTSAKEHGIDVPMSQDFESMPGRGVRAVVEERSLHVGGPGLLRMLAVEPPETLRRAAEARTEERRGGKECGSQGRSRWSPVHEKKK